MFSYHDSQLRVKKHMCVNLLVCKICDLGPDILSGWQTKFVSGVNDHQARRSLQIFCCLKQCQSKICVGDHITTESRGVGQRLLF